jgi:prepilin-type N-terminal cleavage/methylation domain-containing protein
VKTDVREGERFGMVERIRRVVSARINGEDGEAGFTLVELLIVVVVLGILAAVTVFGLSGSTGKSHQAACNSDVRSVEVAVEAYHANNNPQWPPTGPVDVLTQPDKNNNNAVYLRTRPTDTHYTITLGDNGAVLVDGSNYDTNLNATASVNICDAVK